MRSTKFCDSALSRQWVVETWRLTRWLWTVELNEAYWWKYALVSWIIIGSADGLSPARCQDTTWTNTNFLIGSPGTNFNEIWIIPHSSFKKMHLKMLSAKWWPFGSGPNVLIIHKGTTNRHWACKNKTRDLLSTQGWGCKNVIKRWIKSAD